MILQTTQVGFIPTGYTAFDPIKGAVALRRLVASCVLTLTIGGAAAQDLTPLPSMARVANVSGDDMLNVRARATANSTDIGDLPLGAQVEIVGLNEDGSWAQIIVPEGNGWVSARYLEPIERPRTNGGLPLNLTCTGTEPFWSLQLGPDETVALELAAADEKTLVALEWSGTSRNLGPGAFGFSGSGATGVLRRGRCSDGMSDIEYGWGIDIILMGSDNPRLYSGCCAGR